MKSQFNIMCTEHNISPKVIKIIQSLGFTNIRQIDAPTFDISALYDFQKDEQREDIANKIFAKCKDMVHSVEVIPKRTLAWNLDFV